MGLPAGLCHDGAKQVSYPFMKIFVALLASLLLLGCQTLPSAPNDTTEADTTPEEPVEYASFAPDTLFALLTAELAGQRGRFDIALANYLREAQATRDPGVAERAYRISEYLGATEAALDSARIWADSAPENVEARRAAAIQLARAGRFEESLAHMEAILRHKGNPHFDFLALSAAETDPETRAGLRDSFDQLLNRYPDNSQLLYGKALLLQQDGRPEEALALLDHPALTQQEIGALLLRARLLQSLDRGDEALPLLRKAIRQHPDDKRLRLAEARLLVDRRKLPEAHRAFSELVRQHPDDDDLRFSLALVSMEIEDWQGAQGLLETLLERDAHRNAALLHLGRVHEELGRPDEALAAYAQVEPGNEYLPALARQSTLLFERQRGSEAARLLREARASYPEYAVQLYLIEAEAWSRHDQPQRASRLIDQALAEYPGDLNLLYSRAMLAEKRGDLTQLERDLRVILEQEPDNAMALNALGYTLADRTNRHEEARALIEQAYHLSPDDAAVIDSLGWVNYRLGNLAEAERLLRIALEKLPDAEIAAHLGEVLWARGKQREARKVWAEALKSDPDSDILRRTVQRLTGSENP
jgi:tetratricopeptide (TPR) repeat protein